jgi:hypothetical protein
MHDTTMREVAREALIDLWCRDGFKVPVHHNRLVCTLVELAGLSDEIRKRLGAVSDHEAEWRARQGL